MLGKMFQQGDFLIQPGATAKEIAERRRRIEKLRPQFGKAEYIGEGLGHLAFGIGSGFQERALDREQRAGDDEARGVFDRIFSGGFSGQAGPNDFTVNGYATQPQGTSFNPSPSGAAAYTGTPNPAGLPREIIDAVDRVDPDGTPLARGIAETAEAIGMDPVDLATIISYETAGTMDPTKRGPTTQWGQHRGLIQFGEPQAKQYGVNWDDPLGSQLGADGAIARYFRENGYQPGMGLLDAYSIVNAGGPGRYNRSDANNGGAPGTVRDKVEGQMEGHRQRALALLGAAPTPPGQPSPADTRMAQADTQGTTMSARGQQPPQQAGAQAELRQLYQALAHPFMSDEMRAAITHRIQTIEQQADPMRRLQLQKLEMEIAAARNPQPEMTGTQREYQMARQQGFEGSFLDYQTALAEARRNNTNISVGGDGLPGLGKLSTDYGYVLGPDGKPAVDPATGLPRAAPIPGSPADVAAARKDDETANEKSGEWHRANDAIGLIDAVLNSEALPSVTGMLDGRRPGLTQAQTDLIIRIEQLQGQAFLEAFEALKGAGAITEREGQEAKNAIARLQRTQGTPAFRESLRELRAITERAQSRAERGLRVSGGSSGGNAPAPAANAGDDLQTVLNDVGMSEDEWLALSPAEQERLITQILGDE